MYFSKIFIFIVIFINKALSANWESGNIICPQQCLCQYSHFMDLSIARWINNFQLNRNEKNFEDLNNGGENNLINDNEAVFESDESFNSNPLIKQATCILQMNTNQQELFESLPHDVQSLVILYTGGGRNFTVPTSDLKQLNQLSTLEIRGPSDKSLRLLIDEPLSFLTHANFEAIQLIGSENLKRPKNSIHPSESFDYVPSSEKAAYNQSNEFYYSPVEETEASEEEILPYEIYKIEIKKSRMPSFYGWDHLEVLRIQNCKLEELQWEMFDGLAQLQHLSLEENDLKIIPAFALYGTVHIKTLSLARNQILDLNYRALAGLLELEVLDLSRNSLTKLSELTFPPFPKLEFIDFRHNPIRYIFPATFGVMNNTKMMYLGSREMNLELNGNYPFESLELLKQLTITNVSISNLEQNIFKGLKNLEILQVKGKIFRIDFDAFVNMHELRELNLSNCKIREISMDAFIGCKHLEVIDLSNNNLAYVPPGLFDEQTELVEIYLQENHLKFLPSSFFTVPALKLVRLTGNPWKCSCDMAIWKPKITNGVRGMEQERCIRDFHSGKILSCRKVGSYKFENKLSPRCANLKQRSIYYALRKNLQCDFKKELEKHLKIKKMSGHRSLNLKYLDEQKERTLKKNNKNYRIEEQKIIEQINDDRRREHWQQERHKKIRNSLEYLTAYNNANNQKDGMEIEKIMGPIDQHESFNYI